MVRLGLTGERYISHRATTISLVRIRTRAGLKHEKENTNPLFPSQKGQDTTRRTNTSGEERQRGQGGNEDYVRANISPTSPKPFPTKGGEETYYKKSHRPREGLNTQAKHPRRREEKRSRCGKQRPHEQTRPPPPSHPRAAQVPNQTILEEERGEGKKQATGGSKLPHPPQVTKQTSPWARGREGP
ncbi:hypothetical protein E2C01_012450 [Portunus trituberculatus]|uniref:Uncharacterized protein n=1 Tax=Portunus trituberculatus TaxID=210409 RepID=A0A5B7DEQ4_PORTR|nr:hypothetical protein [Portunus trituberculatus]